MTPERLRRRVTIIPKCVPLGYFEFKMLLRSEIPPKFAERANRSSTRPEILFCFFAVSIKNPTHRTGL
jgi:hypothetical protein